MSGITLFDHPNLGSLTTVVGDDGKIYFKAQDVCIVLRLSNPSQQLQRHVKDKWKIELDDGLSRSGKALYLTEAGLNCLIFKSKTLHAQTIQDWVFEEVLPKLRADGGYIQSTISDAQVGRLQENLDKANPQAAWIRDAARLEELESYQKTYGKVLVMLSKISTRVECDDPKASVVKYIESWGKDYAVSQKAAEEACTAFIGKMLDKYEKCPTLFKPQEPKFLKASDMAKEGFSRTFPWEKEYQ
jgi:prophage antirepressor-like protein